MTLRHFFFVALFVVGLTPLTEVFSAEGKRSEQVTAKHSIHFKNPDLQPSWMKIWKHARKARSESDLPLAANLYQQLLKEKPNIEEALREYALLLIDLQQWDTAYTVVQNLLEINPDLQEYLLSAGKIALQLKQNNRAAKFLGQVYTLDPNGPNATIALRGQITALQKQNLKELAYPLMEQLYLLVPHEENTIRQLAKYSVDLGFIKKGINYYTTLLNEFDATDIDFLESEVLFTETDNFEMAVKCWKGYLVYHPYYLSFHKNLSTYYLASDHRSDALKHLLVMVAHGDDRASIYLQIGKLYLYERGRPDKALYYYDEYRKRIPQPEKVEKEIQRIQAILANDLLVIVENEGAWSLWRDLAKVIPDRLAVYYSMAEQLKKLQKHKELREVLGIIHLHSPEDQDVLLQIAQLAFWENDLEASSHALDLLNPLHRKGRDYYLLRAKISEKMSNFSEALDFYISFQKEGGEDLTLLLHSMELASRVGSLQKLQFFYTLTQSPQTAKEFRKKANLLYGNFLQKNALYSTARKFYAEFIKSLDVKDSYHIIIQNRLAKILMEEEKFFEAEQEYRFLLLHEPSSDKYLTKLVENSLLAKDWKNAWKWHEIRVENYEQLTLKDPTVIPALLLEEVAILSQSGKNERAIEKVMAFLKSTPESNELQFTLAELYFRNGEYLDARAVLTTLSEKSEKIRVLLSLIDPKIGIPQSENQEEQNSTVSLTIVQNYLEYGEYQKALKSVNSYLQKYDFSIQASVLKATILQSLNDNFAALDIYDELSIQYPSEEYFSSQSIKINFDSARFAKVIQALAQDSPITQESIQLFTKGNVLLLARSYWAQKQYKKALAIYSEFLKPPVDLLFTRKLNKKNITLQLPKGKRSFLNHITFTHPSEPNRLRIVMTPQFTMENIGSAEVEIVTSLYAAYRWQKFIHKELIVRQEMHEGNYYQAMKEYQKMLEYYPSMESLFDLAGIYSRLGYLGKEAALYQIIQLESPGYPYLDEAMQRNKLKRKPRVSAVYEISKKEGRDGYFDNKQKAGGIDGWYMPGLEQVLSMDYRRIYNQSIDKKQELSRNRFAAQVQWSPSYDIDFLASVGMDHGETDGHTNLLYEFSVNGKLGDFAEGFLSVSQDVIDDTLIALKRGISSVEYEGGVQFDIFSRLFAGGNYRFTDYSDANFQNKYNIWSSYIIHHEPLLLQVRYDYDLSHNDDGNKKNEYNLTGVYGPNDHPYWSQNEYWQHLFSVSFEHQLTDDILGRGAPSYYSLDYTFGYEEGGYGNHQFKGEIFLEISRHYLLNSSFEYIYGSEFEELESNISLIYRW